MNLLPSGGTSPKAVVAAFITSCLLRTRTLLRRKVLMLAGGIAAIAAMGILAISMVLLYMDNSRAYGEAYDEQINAGGSGALARSYAEQIIAGYSPRYARAYADQIDAGQSENVAHAYAENLDAEFSYDGEAHPEDFGHLPLVGVTPVPGYPAAEETASGSELYRIEAPIAESETAINAVMLLAMYSTRADIEANKRAVSVNELTTYIEQANVDDITLLGLLNDIAPEASIGQRRDAAIKLASISDNSSGELTPEQSMQAANEIARLITGHGINAEPRSEAALELVRLSQSGELNAENAAVLMDTVAPEWSIAEREEALGNLAWQFEHGEWDAESTQRTAEEGYTLLTGGEIQIEKRAEVGVELAGEVLKRYGGDQYEDENVDRATLYLRSALRGELSKDRVAKILDLDDGESERAESAVEEESPEERRRRYYNDARGEGYTSKYAEIYANQRMRGKSYTYSHAYTKAFFWYGGNCPGRIRPPCDPNAYTLPFTWRNGSGASAYARTYADLIDAGESSKYAHDYTLAFQDKWDPIYAAQRAAGKSTKYAIAYAEVYRDERHSVSSISRSEYAHAFAFHWDKITPTSTYMATEYARQIDAGRSSRYARVWAHAVGRLFTGSDPRSPGDLNSASEYAGRIVAGESHEYAYTYAQGSTRFDSSQYQFTPDYRHAYAKAFAKQTRDGKPSRYAQAHTDHIVAGYSPEYAVIYANQIEDGKSSRYAHAYTEYTLAGYSGRYARAYAEEMEERKPWVYARRYAEQIDSGRSARFSRAYAWLANPLAAVAAPSFLYTRLSELMN